MNWSLFASWFASSMPAESGRAQPKSSSKISHRLGRHGVIAARLRWQRQASTRSEPAQCFRRDQDAADTPRRSPARCNEAVRLAARRKMRRDEMCCRGGAASRYARSPVTLYRARNACPMASVSPRYGPAGSASSWRKPPPGRLAMRDDPLLPRASPRQARPHRRAPRSRSQSAAIIQPFSRAYTCLSTRGMPCARRCMSSRA